MAFVQGLGDEIASPLTGQIPGSISIPGTGVGLRGLFLQEPLDSGAAKDGTSRFVPRWTVQRG